MVLVARYGMANSDPTQANIITVVNASMFCFAEQTTAFLKKSMVLSKSLILISKSMVFLANLWVCLANNFLFRNSMTLFTRSTALRIKLIGLHGTTS